MITSFLVSERRSNIDQRNTSLRVSEKLRGGRQIWGGIVEVSSPGDVCFNRLDSRRCQISIYINQVKLLLPLITHERDSMILLSLYNTFLM